MTERNRVTLSRHGVATAALEMLDEVGLDALSVRALARRLDVKSPALYWHFRDKQELFDEMSQVLQLSQDFSGPRDGEQWPDWVRRRAHERRALLRRHRDGARLVAITRSGPEVLRRFDNELAILVTAGLTPLAALRAVVSIGHYVMGFVLSEQGDRQRHAAPDAPVAPENMTPRQLDDLLRDTPQLAAAVAAGGDPNSDEAFADGLDMLLAGIVARRG